MSILIRGMEMPTRCLDCLLNTYGYCMASDEHSDIISADTPIPEWCPLVPVPPHGRLIDADALHYSRVQIVHPGGIVGGYNAVVMSAEIKDAPTIIPAEEGE